MAGPQSDLGQHLLRDEQAIRRVVDAAVLQPGEHILDAGAGTGALTWPSAAAVGPSGHVTAVDLDPDMVAALRGAAPPQVSVVEGDILELPFPHRLDAVVANPPFQIAAPLIQRIIHQQVPRSVLVLPRELVDRLAATPGSERYGKLTVKVALRGHVEDLGTLSRHVFDPPPEVPCGIVRIRPRTDARPIDEAVLDAVLDAAKARWDRKAKRAFGGLATRLRADSAALTELLVREGWDERPTRALPPDAFGSIADVLSGGCAQG